MELKVERLDNGIKKISLFGRMDIDGTERISIRMSAETSTEKADVIIDLSGVEFMASIGIGVLAQSYKASKLRGGKLVLLNPQKVVELVLERTLVNTYIPIFYDLQGACDHLLQTAPEK